MPNLPASTDFTGSSVTQGGAKTFMATLRTYLADLLGTDSGDKPAARVALGAAASGANTDITSMASLESMNGGQIGGARNFIHNGSCQVLRGNAAVVNGAYTYGGADAFSIYVAGATASGTIQRYSGFGSAGYTTGAVVTTTGAGVFYAQRRIEAKNAIKLNGKTVTLSMLVFQNTGVSKDCFLYLSKPTTTADVFSAQTTLGTSGTVSIPSGVPTMMTYTRTMGASEASLGLAVSAAFGSIGAVTGKDFWVTDVQFEIGDVATSFELVDYGVDWAACQRNYLVIPPGALGNLAWSAQIGGYIPKAQYDFPVPMRIPNGAVTAPAWFLINAAAPTLWFQSERSISYYSTAPAAANSIYYSTTNTIINADL